MRLKKKFRVTLIILLIICIGLFIFRTKSYQIKYDVDKYHISEQFNKDTKTYELVISNDDISFTILKNHKYIRGRHIIKNIDQVKDNDVTCLSFTPKKVDIESICYKDNDFISPYLVSDNLKASLDLKYSDESLNEKYKKIEIKAYNNHDYFIWNYQGFIRIGKDNNEVIKLFSSDKYEAPLIEKINNYIIIADYDEEYYFNKFYVYDIEKDKVKELDFKYDISFNSSIIGTNKKSIYLLDQKEKKEYEIVPHRLKIRLLKNPVYYDQGLKTTTINKLINNEDKFVDEHLVNYVVKNNILYKYYVKNELIKISDQYVTKIMASNDNEVFYLVNNTLYSYSNNLGEQELFSYYEWTFNNNNNLIIN